ncbi:4Fe-4S dicluster domain-containing protein [Gordonia sp. HNM0687]|uniref:ferredoxin--NADP(+) reductase n=1 Tax=Gordonia mangrovi TaxID=2665643 RepID=A0A6L7GZ85_9ACTN|nr:FAD-dependent oxidoreductase [Gordonia mangrovi]MXP24268.1 4Fe-4S dicluster domain-containing protein [Gordonia mangrovi]UVF79911.1 FAD-dependent oxidoreductase [Gordonia mangrovi]
MTHLITQACCNDASCVPVCPVNCIHPTPAEPEFRTAEMLYIDPETCIDCGACIEECPVSAIVTEDEMTERDEPFLQINADYYRDHDVESGLMRSTKPEPLPDGELHVAIVGAGPAAFYAAEELVRRGPSVRVDMFERLPTPYGLVRAGVAPDHQSTKGVERAFVSVANKKTFEYFLSVEVSAPESGAAISHAELTDRYHAVIYASGASTDKRLGIDGEDLSGSIAATEFVAWYNGHPDHAERTYDLSGERAVIVGNGNVALDVARILLTDPDDLARSDIADHALEVLRESNIREVVILGRRGIAQAAYTNSEFLAMGMLDGVDVVVDPAETTLDPATQRALDDDTLDSTVATKVRLARDYAEQAPTAGSKRVVFRYLVSPIEFRGGDAVDTVRCVRNEFVGADGGRVRATGEEFEIEATAAVRAIGYRGRPVDGLPFDDVRGVVPNDGGRVVTSGEAAPVPGVYVAGWLKRGATGGIGMNRICGHETAAAVLADHIDGRLPAPASSRTDVPELLAARGVNRVDNAGWKKIDKAEKAAGRAAGRRRVKLVQLSELATAAGV